MRRDLASSSREGSWRLKTERVWSSARGALFYNEENHTDLFGGVGREFALHEKVIVWYFHLAVVVGLGKFLNELYLHYSC